MFRVMVVSLLFAVAAGSRLDNRVIGTNANIRDFPYQVSVQYDREHVCGGGLVSRSKVVTAAICTYGYQLNRLSIRHSHTEYAKGIFETVASIVFHPSYIYPRIAYDICVITLTSAIPEQYIANPIPLVAAGTLQGARTCTVAGWGVSIILGSTPSATLKFASARELNKNECNASWPNVITSTMLCFSATTAAGPCKYDNGSPMVCDRRIVGIVILPASCISANSIIPSIYLNIAAQDVNDFVVKQLN